MFGELDATVETETGEKLEIEGFPTVLFFFNGKKIEYDSERTAEDIVDWVYLYYYILNDLRSNAK